MQDSRSESIRYERESDDATFAVAKDKPYHTEHHLELITIFLLIGAPSALFLFASKMPSSRPNR